MAKWWYGRAVEANPTISFYAEARKRFEDLNMEALLA